ncbi:uncharacterized protein CMC5_000690 [Chondromyces crocatus]|uniref:Uncharacterized protein n=1 Tax=Chondromyces crocatus TaxID=52 RepID=A0A0K1E5I5_CHOCO|nr:hypothetical protein [Chondromyces crocatus]AKT35957.1 uncharacterized protein CMC5_000690 [Chondromyces crocatus]
MNERSLRHRLSTNIVEALRARGHIAVVRGGTAALARELEDRLVDDLDALTAKLDPFQGAEIEATTWVDDTAVDEHVSALLASLARTIFSSEHVEDTFAEEPLLESEILRSLREALHGTGAGHEPDRRDEGPARLRLDNLGYLAAMVATRAPLPALRAALERAAQSVGCKLNAYEPDAHEATFSLSESTFSITVADPESRLDLEQAVADELADLVSADVVSLPTLKREIQLSPALPAARLAALRPRIDAAAARILRQGGCSATWSLEDDQRLLVAITPLSDKDASDVGQRAALFAAEIQAMLHEDTSVLRNATDLPEAQELTPEAQHDAFGPRAAHRPSSAAPAAAAPTKKTTTKPASKKSASKKPASKKPASKTPTSKKSASKAPTSKKSAPKKSAPKKSAPKKSASKKSASKKSASKKSPPRKTAARKSTHGKGPSTKAATRKTTTAKKPTSKKPASARPTRSKATR